MQTSVSHLFVHGPRSSRPEDSAPTAMIGVPVVEVVERTGVREDVRYFRRTPDSHERKRQVSLIDQGTIDRLADSFGPIPLEFVKAQVVLAGDVDLPSMLGQVLRFDNGAELTIAVKRVPCYAMDFIHPGLRVAMSNGNQGVLAKVSAGGRIRVGDGVCVVRVQSASQFAGR